MCFQPVNFVTILFEFPRCGQLSISSHPLPGKRGVLTDYLSLDVNHYPQLFGPRMEPWKDNSRP